MMMRIKPQSNHPHGFESFLRDHVSTVQGAMCGVDVAYAEYLRCCEEHNRTFPMGEELFQTHMKERGFERGLSLGNHGHDVFQNALLR